MVQGVNGKYNIIQRSEDMKSGCKNYIFSREVKEKESKSWAGVASAAERRIAWKQRGDSPVLH